VSTFFIHVIEKVDTVPGASPLEVLEACPQAIELSFEHGSVAAGRRVAAERRSSGAPPLTVISDGTVF